jgi:O-antigen/teichoic acid export membrane protein
MDQFRVSGFRVAILDWRIDYYHLFIDKRCLAMKHVDNKYWFELSLITILLIGLGWVAFIFLFPGHYPPILPVMLATVVLLTAAGQVVLSRLLDQKFSKFSSAFLIYKSVKILILMAFMFIYTVLHREHTLYFLGSTFVMYLVFMFFETRSLNRQSRKQAER